MLKKIFASGARNFLSLVVFFCLVSLLSPASAAESKLYDLFWRRSWAAMDEVYASKRDKCLSWPDQHSSVYL